MPTPKVRKAKKGGTRKKNRSRAVKNQYGGAADDILYKGIVNQGNTCYYNSAIQMIYHIPEIRNYILKADVSKDKVMEGIKEIFTKYADETVKGPIEQSSKTAEVLKDVVEGDANEQKDSFEFVTNFLTNRFDGGSTIDGRSYFPEEITKLFKIQEESTISCDGKSIKNEKKDLQNFLTLPIDEGAKTISDLISNYEIEEYIDDLQLCKDIPGHSGKGTKKLRISVPADTRYVILIPKRYAWNGSGSSKIATPIDAPDPIVIANENFHLRGYIYHSGGTGGGHYIYNWNSPDKGWYSFNDSTAIPNKTDKSDSGYLYLYERISPETPGNSSNAQNLTPALPTSPPLAIENQKPSSAPLAIENQKPSSAPLAIENQPSSAPLAIENQQNNAPLAIENQRNNAPLAIENQKPNNAPLAIENQRNNAPLAIENQRNNAPLAIENQRNNAPLAIENQRNNAPLAIENQRNNAPLAIENQGNNAPLAIENQGNNAPLAIENQRNNAPLAIENQRNNAPLAIENQPSNAPLAIENQPSNAPLAIENQPSNALLAIENQKPNEASSEKSSSEPATSAPLVSNASAAAVANNIPVATAATSNVPANVPAASSNVAANVPANVAANVPAASSNVPVNVVKSKPVRSFAPYRFITFGTEAFDLEVLNDESTRGAPGVLTSTDFIERFGDSDDLNIVVRYWNTNLITRRAISEPSPDVFRIPCNPSHIEALKRAFGNYDVFKQNEIAKYGKSAPMALDNPTIQSKKIHLYLNELEKPIPKDCIKDSEALLPNSGPLDPTYYPVLPKIFYLLYRNAKEKKPLKINELFSEYPTLKEDAMKYLKELEKDGVQNFEGDHEIYDVANGVVELFYMLPKLFPNTYKHLIPDRSKAEALASGNVDLIDIKKAPIIDIKGLLLSINLPASIKDEVLNYFVLAQNLYHDDKFQEAGDQIKIALGIIMKYIDSISGDLSQATHKVSELEEELSEVNRKLNEAERGLQEAQTETRERISEFEEELSEANRKLNEAERGLEHSQEETRERISELEEELSEANKKLNEAEIKLGQEDDLITELTTARDAIQSELTRITGERDAAIAARDAAQAERDTVQGNLTRVTGERDAAQAEVTRVTAERDTALASLARASSERNGAIANSAAAKEQSNRNSAARNTAARNAFQAELAAARAKAEADLAAAKAQAQADLEAARTNADSAARLNETARANARLAEAKTKANADMANALKAAKNASDAEINQLKEAEAAAKEALERLRADSEAKIAAAAAALAAAQQAARNSSDASAASAQAAADEAAAALDRLRAEADQRELKAIQERRAAAAEANAALEAAKAEAAAELARVRADAIAELEVARVVAAAALASARTNADKKARAEEIANAKAALERAEADAKERERLALEELKAAKDAEIANLKQAEDAAKKEADDIRQKSERDIAEAAAALAEAQEATRISVAGRSANSEAASAAAKKAAEDAERALAAAKESAAAKELKALEAQKAASDQLVAELNAANVAAAAELNRVRDEGARALAAKEADAQRTLEATMAGLRDSKGEEARAALAAAQDDYAKQLARIREEADADKAAALASAKQAEDARVADAMARAASAEADADKAKTDSEAALRIAKAEIVTALSIAEASANAKLDAAKKEAANAKAADQAAAQAALAAAQAEREAAIAEAKAKSDRESQRLAQESDAKIAAANQAAEEAAAAANRAADERVKAAKGEVDNVNYEASIKLSRVKADAAAQIAALQAHILGASDAEKDMLQKALEDANSSSDKRLREIEAASAAELAAAKAAAKAASDSAAAANQRARNANARTNAVTGALDAATAALSAAEAAHLKASQDADKKSRDALDQAKAKYDADLAAAKALGNSQATALAQAEAAKALAQAEATTAKALVADKERANAELTRRMEQAAQESETALQNALAKGKVDCDSRVKNEKSKLYKDISTHIKGLLGKLVEVTGSIKQPVDLQGLLTAGLEKDVSEYDNSKGVPEQGSMVSLESEVNALKSYLEPMNEKYNEWKKIFEPAVKSLNQVPEVPESVGTQPPPPPLLTNNADPMDLPEQIGFGDDVQGIAHVNKIMSVINDVLTAYRKNGPMSRKLTNDSNQYTDNFRFKVKSMLAPFEREIGNLMLYSPSDLSKDTVGKGHISLVHFRSALQHIYKHITEKPEEKFRYIRLRRLLLHLFKISYLYIQEYICKESMATTCPGSYIKAIYDIFNTITLDERSKKKIVDSLFVVTDSTKRNLVEQIFYLYTKKDNADDEKGANFWKDYKLNEIQLMDDKIDPKILKRFYNINWNNNESLTQFLINIKKEPQRGGSNNRFSPNSIVPVLEEQEAWEEVNDAYNSLEDEHKDLFEVPGEPPVHSVVTVFQEYVDENADPEILEEARNTVGLLSPQDADEAMEKHTDWFEDIVSLYGNAMKSLDPAWVPVMARADMLRVLG